MDRLDASVWLRCYEPRPNARIQLICLPFAGSGASAYRAWSARLPSFVEAVAIQLPGRESRLRETPLDCARSVAARLVPLLLERASLPIAVFGHSMGAIIAFELARMLERDGGRPLKHLFVSARGAPRIRVSSRNYELDDEQFHQRLVSYGGTPRVVLENRSLMDAMVPTLRADFKITEAYRYVDGPKLCCPLTVFAGTRDRLISREWISPWCQETVGPAQVHWFDGDHFFIRERSLDVLEVIEEALEHSDECHADRCEG